MNKPESEYTKQAQAFLDRNGINCRIALSDTKTAPWSDGENRHHYRVTLSKRGQGRSFDNQPRRLVFDFWGSLNDAGNGLHPTAYDVMACISSDATCAETFKDFCADFGESEDSIKALQLFRRCSKFAKRLRDFFTAAELEQLAEIN